MSDKVYKIADDIKKGDLIGVSDVSMLIYKNTSTPDTSLLIALNDMSKDDYIDNDILHRFIQTTHILFQRPIDDIISDGCYVVWCSDLKGSSYMKLIEINKGVLEDGSYLSDHSIYAYLGPLPRK